MYIISEYIFYLKNGNELENLSTVKRHTGIPGLWTQELDAGLWTLVSRRWTLDAALRKLDSGH